MENNKVNILLVCGMGMGTSTMAELNLKKALKDVNIEANLRHTSLGQMNSDREWADIIFILKNLYNQVKVNEGEHIIPIVNIMNGKEMAKQVNEMVEQYYPEAKK